MKKINVEIMKPKSHLVRQHILRGHILGKERIYIFPSIKDGIEIVDTAYLDEKKEIIWLEDTKGQQHIGSELKLYD